MSSSILLSIIITLLIMTICCLSKNNNVTFDCVPSEKKALLRFKASFPNNSSNSGLSSWKNNSDECCSWEGVECDEATGHVYELHFGDFYGLRVEDVAWASNLPSLEYLDMGGVDLSQAKDLIKVLGMLPSLVDLRLTDTGLDDTHLPHTNCVNKSTLLFTNVQHLDLSWNWFGENSSFCFLHNMTSLSSLDLSNNLLHQKADWISDFLSDFLWDECHLKSLNLASNQFYGDISGAFKNLSGCWGRNLESLRFSANELDGHFPEGIGKLKQLKELYLKDNMLSGPVPSSIGNLKALRSMDLANNKMDGSIPESLCQMKDLNFIDLSRNNLSGHLPDCNWGSIVSLRAVIFSSNQLSGPIPNSIGGAYKLLFLQLNNNSLTGKLPSTLGNFTSLSVLDVGDNKLSGKLPEWIGNNLFESLKVLRVRNNKFDGNIPSSYCQLSNVQIMDLALNHLTGDIPHCFGNLSGMIKVSEGIDYFLGVSFSEMMKGALMEYTGYTSHYLVNLDLSSNNLFGEIPSDLTNLIALNGLNLSYNHLGGTIPQNIGDLNSLESFDFSNNNFSRTIPVSLSKLTSLSHLNLSNNDLSGPIPTGPQLQTLNDPSSYGGNPGLCGDPLPKKCNISNNEITQQQTRKAENEDGGMKDKIYLYAFIISGVATGFWGYFGVLFFKRSWRLALFRRMDVLIGKMLGRF